MKKKSIITEPSSEILIMGPDGSVPVDTASVPVTASIPGSEQPAMPIRTHVHLKHVKMVSITYERKFNLDHIKKYESILLGVTEWADVDPDEEDPDAVISAMFLSAKAHIKEQFLPLQKKPEKAKNNDPQYVPTPPTS